MDLHVSWNIVISTHTSRVGCDYIRPSQYRKFGISTHTSRVGCDGEGVNQRTTTIDFYSHIPCGM